MTSPMPTMAAYERALLERLWAYADGHLAGHLDGGRREGRPPVLAKGREALNVVVPDVSEAEAVRALMPGKERHLHYGSMKSSQALAQSIFGLLLIRGRLDLLAGLEAECGRPAFFADASGWTGRLEHEVESLEERRKTSVDVWLKGPEGARVAVECKFAENEFGRCSRPRLRPGDSGYPEQLCDGSYSVQRGRTTRCSLSEIGIRYWDYLPALFDWPADVDHALCPFGETYQIGRNALAATVGDDESVDPGRGHVLIVYDARNPAFADNGRSDRQWRMALDACRVPGLLRRVTWQRILGVLAADASMTRLLVALEAKYGLFPDTRGMTAASRETIPRD
ncbi:PGN_0703 family putative restriction endonuclease [Minwuia thermotolerans]|uniref:Restriction endonuclease n=1 Tax=Minwuia thermotolerans TaxID=2056226 RepID=A0A2M9FXY3_9PROT|nr:hypothetical protein [Minwuia thermotolerans]PJK28325.1 hypothetical protein CVT23_18315 [Minwuia thermotolerans]